MLSRIIRLSLTALAAWLTGLAVIAMLLYVTNGGVDFTLTDLMGFGVLYVIASGLLMLVLYLPFLFWLKRRGERPFWYPIFSGLLLNVPIFVMLATLIGRKMVATEAIAFMFIFFLAGSIFGLGFLWANRENPSL